MTDDNEILATLFKQGPLQDWILEEIFGDKLMRFAQAYLMMARNLEYRPAAPALTPEQYAGPSRWRIVALFQRARNRKYARAAVRDSLMRGESPIASHLEALTYAAWTFPARKTPTVKGNTN